MGAMRKAHLAQAGSHALPREVLGDVLGACGADAQRVVSVARRLSHQFDEMIRVGRGS